MSDFDKCCVCYCDYDLGDHMAVTLRQCDHNIGKTCAEKILCSNSQKCPICRIDFPSGAGIKYLPSRFIKEKLQKEKELVKCPIHQEKFLGYYCKTDKCRVCVDCLVDDGPQGHNGHPIEKLTDLRVKVAAKRKILEDTQKGWREICEEGKGLLDKRRLEQTKNIESFERITKLVVFESHLKAQTFYKKAEEKLEELFEGTDIGAKISEYRDFQNGDLEKLLYESLEDYTGRFDQTDCMDSISQSLTEEEAKLPMPSVKKDTEKMSLEAPLYPAKLAGKGHLEFKSENNCFIIVMSDKDSQYNIDIDELEKHVHSIKFIFEKFDFNDQDMLIVNYIWTRLQPQIRSLSVAYKQTKDSVHKTKFQEHFIEFSRSLVPQSQDFQSFELCFEQSDGSDRYIRVLTEKIMPRFPNLRSLKINCDRTDLTEETFIAFCKATKTFFKGLEVFCFEIKQTDLNCQLFNSSSFQLPNLKEFTFKIARSPPPPSGGLFSSTPSNTWLNTYGTTWVPFLSSSLASMKSLGICQIETDDNAEAPFSQLVGSLSKMPCLKAIKIDMPKLTLLQVKLGQLLSPLSGFASIDLKINIKVVQSQPLFNSSQAPSGGLFGGLFAAPSSGTNPPQPFRGLFGS